MELRHLRYFIAVAEEGSLTLAAQNRLHTSQPLLSRQIRTLEDEIGTALITRSVHGIELTQAGRVFLDHARLGRSGLHSRLQDQAVISSGRQPNPTSVACAAASMGVWGSAPRNATSFALSSRTGCCQR